MAAIVVQIQLLFQLSFKLYYNSFINLSSLTPTINYIIFNHFITQSSSFK